jgi:hypothetical protein
MPLNSPRAPACVGWLLFWIALLAVPACGRKRPRSGSVTLVGGHTVQLEDPDLRRGNRFNCSDFRSWRDAQAVFEASGPGDPHRLDGDRDGVACEALR